MKWVAGCCLIPSEQYFSYMMARTSNIVMLCAIPNCKRHNPQSTEIKTEYAKHYTICRKWLCIIHKNLPLKGFAGMLVRIIYDMFWETFFQDVECDGTDISDDIDWKIRGHIQSIVPTLEQFHCYIYVWTVLFCCFRFILIKINISTVLHFISVSPSWFSHSPSSIWIRYLHHLLTILMVI